MSKGFDTFLAHRFAPLNFSLVPGFPNTVPIMDKWGDCLPRFREKEEDNPTDHVIKFHQCMDQLSIHHEDVLTKNVYLFIRWLCETMVQSSSCF